MKQAISLPSIYHLFPHGVALGWYAGGPCPPSKTINHQAHFFLFHRQRTTDKSSSSSRLFQ